MNAYLPANSEIVISRNGAYEWYTTKQQVDVSNYTTGICPIRNGLTVLTATVKGFQVWFLENQVEVELTEAQKNFVSNHKFVSIQYDIPTRVSTHAADYPDERGNSFQHPSQWMWQYGVRTTLSCWLMTEQKYQAIMRRLRGLTRAGCTWEPTNIDSANAGRKLMGAIVSLRKEWISADKSYEENMRNARIRRDERGQGADSLKTYQNDCTRNEKELDKRRKNIEDGAKLLSIPMEWVSKVIPVNVPVAQVHAATSVRAVSNAHKVVGKDVTEAHCEMVDALRNKGLTAEADAVESGEMGHAYAADICEEHGILCDENGVFSLRDVFKGE